MDTKIALKYLEAELRYIAAHREYREFLRDNPCVIGRYEWFEEDTGSKGVFCWREGPIEDWCENCQKAQPLYQARRAANKETQYQRKLLHRRLKRIIDKPEAK